MAGGLRYETGRDMPPGMQELFAKRFIDEKAGQVISAAETIGKGEEAITLDEADVMLAVIKEIDFDCEFCKYAGGNMPCEEESIAFSCDGCTYDCPCNGCRNNSKYVWCGAEEALNRLGLMQREET